MKDYPIKQRNVGSEASWEGLQCGLRLAWWELGNKPRPATAGANLWLLGKGHNSSWGRLPLVLALELPGSSFSVSRGWSLLMPARECLGKTAMWAKACLHLSGGSGAYLALTSARQAGWAGEDLWGMPHQGKRCQPGYWRVTDLDQPGGKSITTKQWHLPKFPSPERFPTHPCPSSPTLGFVN